MKESNQVHIFGYIMSRYVIVIRVVQGAFFKIIKEIRFFIFYIMIEHSKGK